jgi:hypothetical protein
MAGNFPVTPAAANIRAIRIFRVLPSMYPAPTASATFAPFDTMRSFPLVISPIQSAVSAVITLQLAQVFDCCYETSTTPLRIFLTTRIRR